MIPDPDPSYDVSDEAEFYFRYFTWGLRGVTRRRRIRPFNRL